MKNDDTHDLRVSAQTARLTATESDDGPPWRFSGVAVAAGDILHMDDGTRVLMTAEELRKAAESQAEEPLTADHPEDAQGRPQYPPPVEETVGKVTKAGWLESAQAVGYEATTHDEEIADGVRGGTFEVSVHPRFELGEHRDDVRARVAENIVFLDLSVVAKGDSPSNTAEWGPSQALASYTHATDIGAELTATSTTMSTSKRQQYVELIESNTDFSQAALESMDDSALERTFELLVQDAVQGDSGDGGDGGASSGASVAEKIEALEEQLLTEEGLREVVEDMLGADGDGAEAADELEAYSSGVAGESRSGALGQEMTAEERREMIAGETDDDPDAYDTGVMPDISRGASVSPSDELLELVGADSEDEYYEMLRDRDLDGESEPEPLDKYGTGVKGDQSATEFSERRERAEALTEALEEADVDLGANEDGR